MVDVVAVLVRGHIGDLSSDACTLVLLRAKELEVQDCDPPALSTKHDSRFRKVFATRGNAAPAASLPSAGAPRGLFSSCSRGSCRRAAERPVQQRDIPHLGRKRRQPARVVVRERVGHKKVGHLEADGRVVNGLDRCAEAVLSALTLSREQQRPTHALLHSAEQVGRADSQVGRSWDLGAEQPTDTQCKPAVRGAADCHLLPFVASGEGERMPARASLANRAQATCGRVSKGSRIRPFAIVDAMQAGRQLHLRADPALHALGCGGIDLLHACSRRAKGGLHEEP
eukprot:scaffold65992_cov75-Phaeocystis_antarctica.AAC.7